MSEPDSPGPGPLRALSDRLLRPLHRLKDWVLRWGDHPAGAWALLALAFAESSFFPIPPDLLLIALAVGRPDRAWRFAAICTAGSVAGGVAGYGIGLLAAPLGKSVIVALAGLDAYYQVAVLYGENAFLAVVLAGFTPIPYKVFTIAAGIFHDWVGLDTLIVASILSRGARFYLVAWVCRWLGPRARVLLDRHLGLATLALGLLFVAGIAAIGGMGGAPEAARWKGLAAELASDDSGLRAEAFERLSKDGGDGFRAAATGYDPARPPDGEAEPLRRVAAWAEARAGPPPPGLDRRLFGALNPNGGSPVLDRVFGGLDSDPVILGIWAALGMLSLAVGGTRARATVGVAALAWMIAFAGNAGVLKPLVRRERPAFLPEARVPPGVETPTRDDWSFPSSHAATSGAVATAALARHPLVGAGVAAFALVVGYSRIYVGLHYPGDVGAGYLLGALVALAVLGARRRLAERMSGAPPPPIPQAPPPPGR